MEHKKTMLDYIADCPEFIRNNVADSAALTKPLVDEYVSGGYKNIWIVACGSSSNGSLCARQFIRRQAAAGSRRSRPCAAPPSDRPIRSAAPDAPLR